RWWEWGGEEEGGVGQEEVGLGSAFEGGRAVQLDLSGLALGRERRVDVTHQGNRGRAASSRPPLPLLRRNVSKDAQDASRARASLRDRHRLGHLDTFAADPATLGGGLDPPRPRPPESPPLG